MNKKVIAFLSSTVGIAAMAIVLIILNFMAGQMHMRADLTEDKVYTLSEGTREIVGKLNSPVTIRFYCSRGRNELPVYLKSFSKRVEDLLVEYQLASNGKIRIEKFDPQPDSDAEDAASLDGVDGQMLQTGDKIYLGLSVSQFDQTEAIPFLSPNNENTLEYDISRLVYRVSNPGKSAIGIMSSLPVMGTKMPPQMGGFGAPPQGDPPWTFVGELKKDFEVREVDINADAIPSDMSTLIVIHPKDISDKTQYAIDQFILKGGKLIAFVDPMSVIEAQQKPANPMQMSPPGSSTLEKLFSAWGVEFDASKVLIDMEYATEVGRTRNERQLNPLILSLDQRAMNADDITSKNLDRVVLAFGGAFSGDGAEGLEKTALITSSERVQKVESFRAQFGADSLAKEFKSEDKQYDLALRLVGKFKSAFPNGAPKDGEEEATGGAEHLTESSAESAVVLIGDSDLLFDDFWVQKSNLFGRTILQMFSDNNNLLQNCTEQLSGDASLISIRSRGISNRPFLVVRDMQLEAEKQYKAELDRLEEDLRETERKISELQRTKKDQSQRFVLSAEQMKEIEKFNQKKVDIRKTLKETRKRLRSDVEKLEFKLKFRNIAGMPIVVALFGIAVAMIRRRG